MFLKAINKLFAILSFLFLFCNHVPDNQTNTNKVSGEPSVSPVTDTLDYKTKEDELRKNLTDEFLIKHSPYFIVVSNLSENSTDEIIKNTIGRAVECFYNDYFEKRPDDITTIFLFKDDAAYRYWAKKLYDDTDLSRFGYYKPSSKVMLMNISTGTGTLVHELTHALVRYDFPDIPSWFNEGLGSLYERCSLNNGIILGYVNWRLPALQDAITDNSYTDLKTLVNTTEDEFYGSNSGFYYAQARYLCLYLQEKGLLKKFYKSFRDGYGEDNTGKKFLEQVTGYSLSALNTDFKNWAKTLKYEN